MKPEACPHRIAANQLKVLASSMTETSNARPIQNTKWGMKNSNGSGDYLDVLTKSVYVPSQIVVEAAAAATTVATAAAVPQVVAAALPDYRATPPTDGQGGRVSSPTMEAMQEEAAEVVAEQ